MRSGRLSQRVTIARHVETTDDYGELISTTSTFATRWAAIEPIAGREYFTAQGANSQVSVKIRMRYDTTVAAIDAGDIIIHGGVTYDIESVINPSLKGEELILMCKTGVRNNER